MENRRNLMLVGFLGLFMTAVALTVTSAALPAISKDLQRPVADFGPLFFSFFFGFTIVVGVAGAISDVVGRKVVAVGLGLISGGLLLFGVAHSTLAMHAAILLVGAGCGITEGTSTTLIADLNPHNQGVWLNFSQVFFAVGAILTPMGVGILAADASSWRLSYLAAGASALCCFVFAIVQRYPKLTEQEAEQLSLEAARKLFANREFGLVFLAMLFYVASEQGFASWLPSYFENVLKAPVLVSSASLSVLWSAMVVGRVAGSYLLRFLDEASLIIYSSLVSMIVLGFSFVTVSCWLALVGVFFVGLGYAPIWATILSYGVQKVVTLKGSATGVLIAAGSIGGLIYPAMIGELSSFTGFRTAYASVLIPITGIFLIFRSLSREGRTRSVRASGKSSREQRG